MRNELIEFMLDVRGKFGHEVYKLWPPTFVTNDKGGMEESKFEKYAFVSIVPLYTCA